MQVQKLQETSILKGYVTLPKVILQIMQLTKKKCHTETVKNILQKVGQKKTLLELVPQVSKLGDQEMEIGLACLEHKEKNNN